jgi:hypothetical protein
LGAQSRARAIETAFYSAYGQLQNGGNVFVGVALHIEKHQNRTMVLRQSA